MYYSFFSLFGYSSHTVVILFILKFIITTELDQQVAVIKSITCLSYSIINHFSWLETGKSRFNCQQIYVNIVIESSASELINKYIDNLQVTKISSPFMHNLAFTDDIFGKYMYTKFNFF